MKCAICGMEEETIDQAIESDWLPHFYKSEIEHDPVCSSCAETMIMIICLSPYFNHYLVISSISEM